MPDFVEPQLCRSLEKPPAGPGWAHEVKFDGYRMQLRIANGKATLLTRKGLDWTDRISRIAAEAAKPARLHHRRRGGRAGRRRRARLLRAAGGALRGTTEDLVFFVFDLLFDRARTCAACRSRSARRGWRTCSRRPAARHPLRVSSESPATRCWSPPAGWGWRASSPSGSTRPTSGRSDTWSKSKCRAGHEVVIGGWTSEPDSSARCSRASIATATRLRRPHRHGLYA